MKINIVAVGNLKEKFFVDAAGEYLKRLKKFCEVSVVEIQEKNQLQTPAAILAAEAKDINKHLNGYVVVLDIEGKKLDSIALSKKIEQIQQINSTITFVIGSSYGLDESIKDRADLKLSFSDMTFAHQLFRVMLLEQIYRAFCISNNITYHK